MKENIKKQLTKPLYCIIAICIGLIAVLLYDDHDILMFYFSLIKAIGLFLLGYYVSSAIFDCFINKKK